LTKCLNLKKLYGERFRVEYEESYYTQYGANGRVDDPWLQTIPCRHGHFYPFGGNFLVASTSKHGAVARALAGLPCVTVQRDGDDGLDSVFHKDDFEIVANLMKPRRKRQVSDQERTRLATLGRTNLNRYRNPNVGSPKLTLETHGRVSLGSGVV
jgi:hypothetical protein